MPDFSIAALFLIVAVVSYLLGSISFSIIFTKKLYHNTDIRTLGSGNAGLTNVLRSVGMKAGIPTLIFDSAKGIASVCIGRAVFQHFGVVAGMPPYCVQYGAYVAGLFCMLGHVYPLYFGFRGGKGVLSSAAVLLMLDWRLFIVAIGVFIVVFLFSKIVSLGSVLAAASFPIANFLFVYFQDYKVRAAVPLSYVWITTLLSLLIASMVVWKHRENIKRLKNGTEERLTVRK